MGLLEHALSRTWGSLCARVHVWSGRALMGIWISTGDCMQMGHLLPRSQRYCADLANRSAPSRTGCDCELQLLRAIVGTTALCSCPSHTARPPPPRVNGQASNIWARVAGEGDRRSTVRNPSMLGHAITSADDDGDADLGALNKRDIVYALYAAVIDVSGHLNSCIRTWRTEHACRQDAPNSGLGLVRATATHCAPRPDRRLHPMIRQIAHGARPHILSLHSSGKPLRDNSGHPPGVALFVLSPCASTLVAALANA